LEPVPGASKIAVQLKKDVSKEDLMKVVHLRGNEKE
jgi:hypothetical protein